MKKLLLLPIALLLIACEPTDEPMEALREVGQTVEASMLPRYPYFSEWERCEINGETYEQVQFLYTDIGLGYIVDDIITYRADLEITYCEGVIVEGING